MQVLRIGKDGGKEFEKFVKSYGSVEQSFEWGELQCAIPGRSGFFVFGVFSEGELTGSILVIRQEMSLGKSWLWCPRGPVIRDWAAWPLLRAECEKLAREGGDLYLRIEPGVETRDEFLIFEKETSESYMPEETLMVTLSVPENEILKQMAQKGRYNIKIAEKAGVEVRRDCVFQDFYAMLCETAKRDGFHVHGPEFYEQMMDFGKFYGAFLDGQLIAGIIVTWFGETATYYFGASSGSREVMAPYLLQWTAMREAKAAGMKFYDFLGVSPEGSVGHSLSGVTQFKTRFGGHRVKYHRARVLVFRPFWTWLVRLAKRAV